MSRNFIELGLSRTGPEQEPEKGELAKFFEEVSEGARGVAQEMMEIADYDNLSPREQIDIKDKVETILGALITVAGIVGVEIGLHSLVDSFSKNPEQINILVDSLQRVFGAGAMAFGAKLSIEGLRMFARATTEFFQGNQ